MSFTSRRTPEIKHGYFLGYNLFTIHNYRHCLNYIFLKHDITQGCTNFQTSRKNLKFLGARKYLTASPIPRTHNYYSTPFKIKLSGRPGVRDLGTLIEITLPYHILKFKYDPERVQVPPSLTTICLRYVLT
jgi:hypothetical protein